MLTNHRVPAPGRTLLLLLGTLAALLLPAPAAFTQEALPAAAPADGPLFPIGPLDIRYLRDNPLHPPIEQAMAVGVELGRTATGYVAPREDVPIVVMSLADIDARPTETYHATAIQHILEAVRDYYVDQNLIGVFAAPEPSQINEIGQDIRRAGDSRLTILVTTGIVTELRTIGSGPRVSEERGIAPEDRVNNPLHRSIIERSPIRVSTEDEEVRMDLLRRDELDRYLFHLGRHPGRRVDASVAAAQDVGTVALDYMITENNPLTIYLQGSNTGSESTDKWRERIGFFTTQFSNNDDILSVDYTTASFDEVHALSASYDAPFANDRIRWRVYGGYSEYTASEVGFFGENFEGQSYSVGGEIAANIHQDRQFFVDLVGGLRYQNIEVDNQAFLIRGEQDFVIPYLGMRMERNSEWFSTNGQLMLEFGVDGITNIDPVELAALGRTDPDEDWQVLKGAFTHSVFLEPVLDREGWEDPSTPESSTLAHELLFSARGQYAFDNRLIPQEEQVAGGLYTVRGYPQSVVAGDSVIIASAEYRYHVPRDFDIQPEPTSFLGDTFRSAPQYVYGVPDWDLILKGFVDYGRVLISDRFSFENNETLLSAGVGIEFLFRRNLSLRVDWGWVLEDLPNEGVNDGSNRVHFVGTLLF
ncbi:MAG: hypothetical protein KJO43_14375 [Phycisphaerae bacterium]|nr:hypothetical protein [Phycisphaerae bacterium]NNF42233.1 ShlB/FhaC/HecB family hemolysin secretion/activation protein [Phycisphaerales bacterium]